MDEQRTEDNGAEAQVGLDRIPDVLEEIKKNQLLLASHQNELAGLIEEMSAQIEVERLKRGS